MREEFDLSDWRGPFDSATQMRARDALEQGQLLYFPQLAFPLQAGEEEFLDASLTDGKAKNISLDHSSGRLQGTSATGPSAVRLAAMIERFGAGATRLVGELLGNLAELETKLCQLLIQVLVGQLHKIQMSVFWHRQGKMH